MIKIIIAYFIAILLTPSISGIIMLIFLPFTLKFKLTKSIFQLLSFLTSSISTFISFVLVIKILVYFNVEINIWLLILLILTFAQNDFRRKDYIFLFGNLTGLCTAYIITQSAF